MTIWTRDSTGKTIHRSDCRIVHRYGGCQWEWPETMGYTTGARLLLALEGAGAQGPRWNQPCKVCHPFDVGDPKCVECGDRWPVEHAPYPELCAQCGLVAHREDQADRKGN